MFKRFAFLVALALLTAFAAAETIEGVVKDNTGGVIPGVSVTLTNTDNGNSRQLVTDDQGYFIFNNVRPGNFELKAELEGFQPVKTTGIKLDIGGKLNFPITLSVSEVTTEVEVRAAVEQVETTTSQLDNVIDEKRITDLPLNGRNPMGLVFLTPGVATGTGGQPSANGTRMRGNNYQLDGVDNNDTSVYGVIVDVNVDATSEFRVITSNPSAEYGRAGGAIVDVITKSGTNEFHGNAFWFHRNDNLDANSWSDNRSGIEKGEFKRNQFGASIGGPIIKDKLFFFFNTEWLRVRNMTTQATNVPTQEFRAQVTNTEMARIFNTYYPLPNNLADASYPGINGVYYFPFSDPYDSEQYTTKINYNLGSSHVFEGRFFYNNILNDDARILPTTDLGRQPDKGHTKAGAINWTWIINPTLVNEIKIGQNRLVYGWYRVESNPVDISFGGFRYDSRGFFASFGGPVGYGDQWRNTGTFEFKDTVSWTTGDHNLKFGVDLRFAHANGETNFDLFPEYYFDDGDGNMDANIQSGQVQYVYQALYGNGVQYYAGGTDHRGWRSHEYDFFVQDDWKIRPNLTLNLGLRYELKPTPYEVNNMLSNLPENFYDGYHLPNMGNFFDPANWEDGIWSNFSPNWTGEGREFYLTDGNTKIFKAPKTNFAPRLGISWDPWGDGKTAIRGGYGISYDRLFDNLLTWNTAQLPFGQVDYVNSAAGGKSGIYPDVSYYGNGVAVPAVTTMLPAGSWYEPVNYNYNWKSPYVQTWNFSVQRELWAGNILNITYAGSAGVHMLCRNNPNQMPKLTAAQVQQINDEFNGGTMLNDVPFDYALFMVRNSQFYRFHYIDTAAHSNYNALQASFSHRYQNGLQFQINYTWSKAFDNNSESVYSDRGSSAFFSDYYNPSYDRGYSSFDVRQIFNCNFIYELPFGPGKMLGGNTTGVVAAIIGGWQINGILSASTGYPLDYKTPYDTLGTFYYGGSRGPARPNFGSMEVRYDPANNIVGPVASNFDWENSINIANPQGDYYRGYFRAPGFWNVDFSLFKEVKTPWFTSEGAKIQFRAEAFNLFNHTNYNSPSITLTSANLGKTFGAAANRQVQLGLKFIF